MALKEGPDDYSNSAIVRSMNIKNHRIINKWQQLVKAIEIQKTEKSQELNDRRSKLLTQREKTITRTASLSNMRLQNEEASLHPVHEDFVASFRNDKAGCVNARTNNAGIQRPTQSSEKKKVARKKISLSLNELQKRGEKPVRTMTRIGEQRTSVHVTEDTILKSKCERRPRSAFDLTEEEEKINPKLYSSPTALPKIYLQKTFRPKFRSFERDEEFRKKISVNEETWKDIHHCRYLRIHPLQRSRTLPDLKHVSSGSMSNGLSSKQITKVVLDNS